VFPILTTPSRAPTIAATKAKDWSGGGRRSRQIVVHDLAKIERQVGEDVNGGNHLKQRQFGEGRQSVGKKAQLGWPGPGALEVDVDEGSSQNLFQNAR